MAGGARFVQRAAGVEIRFHVLRFGRFEHRSRCVRHAARRGHPLILVAARDRRASADCPTRPASPPRCGSVAHSSSVFGMPLLGALVRRDGADRIPDRSGVRIDDPAHQLLRRQRRVKRRRGSGGLGGRRLRRAVAADEQHCAEWNPRRSDGFSHGASLAEGCCCRHGDLSRTAANLTILHTIRSVRPPHCTHHGG